MLAPREIDEYLLPTERRVIRVRMHWAVMAKNLISTGLFLLLMIWVQRHLPERGAGRQPHLLSVAGRGPAVHLQTILWWIERIVITDKRVMLAEGFLVHNVGMMPLSKVTDLTFQRSFGGRLLGYGTLIVESAGQIQALSRIDYIPRPEEVYEALSELIFGEKGRTRATGMLAKPRLRADPEAGLTCGDGPPPHRPAHPLHGSDGTDSPGRAVAAARGGGLDVLALTDHDTTAGWDAAAAARRRA